MERQELEDKVLKILEPYTRPELPFSSQILEGLRIEELRGFYYLLTNSLMIKKGKKRPRCPPITLEKSSIGNTSLYSYKKEMCDYIAYITGGKLKFKSPSILRPALLESTVNYFKKKI